jgi:hypothetical protein
MTEATNTNTVDVSTLPTMEEYIGRHRNLKPASLYNALAREIKSGALRGTAMPLNRNDPSAKFKLQKAAVRGEGSETKDAVNFVILDVDAFDTYVNEHADEIRAAVSATGAKKTPTLDTIRSGAFTLDQLKEMAAQAASRRYGSRGRGRKPKAKDAPAPAADTAPAASGGRGKRVRK